VDAGPTVSFRDDVAPALTVCLSCHSQRNTHAEASALVTANAPARSVLYQRITSMGRPMPPSGPLLVSNPAGTALIERWILQGAPNN